jgi:tRNA dimethylallyltransferase
MSHEGRVVVIVGPTAVGKSALAIDLAERLKGEIVSADSRLLYRGMDIGTAKPSVEQRNRITHHLIDVADPRQTCSLAQYRQRALSAVRSIMARGHLPFLVGGTGQYVRAVIDGWVPPPRPPDDRIRRVLNHQAELRGDQALHAWLAILDPQAAASIDYRNRRRAIRALEVCLTTGQRFSALRRSDTPPFSSLWVGLKLPRPALYARIDDRLEEMLRSGLVEEVRSLLAQGVPPDAPPLSAIGYKQIADYLQGRCSLDEAKRAIRSASRRLVRRQANWFKPDDPRIHYFQAGEHVADQVERLIRGWLASAPGSEP